MTDFQDKITHHQPLTDYEIERGKPAPSKNHARASFRLTTLLLKYESKFDLMPELSLELSTGKSTPDFSIYPNLVYNWTKDEIRLKDAPLTTIEILSPSQSIDDLVAKAQDYYFPAGVKSCWFVIPAFGTIFVVVPDWEVLTFTKKDVLKDPTNGIEIRVAEIFA